MNISAPRLVFAGTSEFAVPSLQRLIAAGHRLLAVYTQPDRPAGRGRRMRPSPVKRCAVAANVPVRQPLSLDTTVRQQLTALAPDVVIVIAYGLLLPQAVLAIPRLGCINCHASLLPRWRGAAPIQRALLAGDLDTGVTLMQMDAGLDSGPILAQTRCPIEPGLTGGELHDRLALLAADLLLARLPAFLAGQLNGLPQDDQQASYAAKLSKAEAELDWQQPAQRLARQINAFNPWPVAWTRWAGNSLRLWRARALAGTASAAPGTVVRADRQGVVVVTGDGLLELLELQLPGRKVLPAAAFINAHALQGSRLGQ